MKTLIKILALCLPLMMLSNPIDSTESNIKKIVSEIIQEKQSLDSINHLISIERSKQLLLKMKRSEHQNNLIHIEKPESTLINKIDSVALKKDYDYVFWEEKLYLEEQKLRTQIVRFRFENGLKIYLR